MRSLTTTRHQKRVCQVLLVAFCLSLPIVSSPLVQAQTAADANELLQLSLVQNRTNHIQALQTAEQALAIFTGLADQTGINEANSLIATYHMAMGNLTQAKTLFEQVRQFWQSQQNSAEEATALLNLSFIEQRRGEFSNALQYLAQAEPLISAQTQPGMMARLVTGFALIYNESGLNSTARTEYQRAMDYFLKVPNSARAVNRMKLLIGYTYVLQGDYGAAATHLNEALANLTLDLDKAQCHEYLGRMYIGLQDYNVALEHLQTALESYESAQNHTEALRVHALIGQINEQQGNLTLARKRYRDALEVFKKVGNRANEAAIKFSLGKLELKVGDYDRAETYLKQAVETTEDLRRATIARDLTTAYSATVYERYQTYVDCLIRKHKLQPSRHLYMEAFRISELARARALAELLRDAPPVARPYQALAKRERTLRQVISSRISDRISLLTRAEKTTPEFLEKLNIELAQLETGMPEVRREHAEIVEQLRKADPLFDQIQQPTAYTLEQVQREVIDDEQTVLLEFMLSEAATYVWAVRKNDFKFYELQNQATINKAAKEFYALIAEAPNSETDRRLKEATAQLAKFIIEPLAGELNVRRVIIVADGALHYVPFQLLPSPANQNEPLVANHEIVNVPSASILGQLRKEKQQRQPTKKLLAAFGDPVFPANYAEFKRGGATEMLASTKIEPLDPWRRAWRDIEIDADHVDPSILQPLTYSKFELQKLSDLGGSAALIQRGFAASRENLTRLKLSDFSVLHFATHGVLDPQNPEVTGFFLSMLDNAGRPQNGFMTTPDIYALHAPVDLVVLSACRTGLGKGIRGEGLIGLTSGFMHAGASSVAATLWKVDDNATSQLMDHFYTNMLQKNMRPAEALRAAQNVLRQDPRWQSPHYWAAFTLQGEYQNTIRIPPPTGASRTVQNAVGAFLLVLLLLGIGWGFWRRRGPRPAVK